MAKREPVKKSITDNVISGVVGVGDKIISILSGLLAASLILYSGYVLYDTFYTQNQAYSSSWEKFQSEIIDTGETPTSAWDGLIKIKDQYPDYRGWLTIYDTDNNPDESKRSSIIDYPLMQGTDDLYYASHDYTGASSLTGSIYLAAANNPNLNDAYNIIYGHHMDRNAMFGALDNYVKEDYFNAHRDGLIIAGSGIYDLKIFAVVQTDAYEGNIYKRTANEFGAGNSHKSVIDFVKKQVGATTGNTTTLFYDDAVASSASKVVALSTCSDADTNGRLVVLARADRRQELFISVSAESGTYDGSSHSVKVSSNMDDTDQEVTYEYSTDGGNTWTTVPPTLTDVGTLEVMVRASVPGYEPATSTVTLSVDYRDVTVRAVAANKIMGQADPVFTVVIEGLLDGDTIEYTIVRNGNAEAIGNYVGAIVPAGEEYQGNYRITYVPANFAILDPGNPVDPNQGEEPDNPDNPDEPITIDPEAPPLQRFISGFIPEGSGEEIGKKPFALLNLVCLLVTLYLFIPFTHLKDKFKRLSLFKNVESVAKHADEKGILGVVRRLKKMSRIGAGLELVICIAALVIFIITEDIRNPLVLIDRYTPVMIVGMALCWIVDVRFFRVVQGALSKEAGSLIDKVLK